MKKRIGYTRCVVFSPSFPANDMRFYIQHKQSHYASRHLFETKPKVMCFASFINTELLSLPGCATKCGNLTIPFPFGMSSECYFDDSFYIICNSSFKPPKPFLRHRSAEVVSISLDGKLELLSSSPVRREVVEWAAGNVDCHVAQHNGSRYACRSMQSQCIDSSVERGHVCRCLPGYLGNPYLVDGCQDIDECSVSNPCVGICINFPGSFKCYCPKGLVGDGRKNGGGCYTQDERTWSASVYLPIGILVMAPLLATTWIAYLERPKKLDKLREELFKRNGGNLLQRKLARRRSPQLSIHTADEMKSITNSYGDKTIMLRCKPGDFYLGNYNNAKVVVVMVERVAESHIEQFVDQLVFLSQPHKNLVRVLGCCLETQSPLIVYELHGDGNATLFDCMHCVDPAPVFSCELRVKAAEGVARGLAYLNSHKFKATFVHGSICSANILMNSSYDPKIFYVVGSNLISRDADQENYVYTDPEPLNKKSDVYSFGVVLVELLTGGKTVSPNTGGNDRRMALDFVFLAKAGRLGEILDEEMVGEGEVVNKVAKIAERCLNVAPDRRPNMKKVSAELTSLMQMA